MNNFLLKDDKVRIIDFTYSTCLNYSNRFNDLSFNKREDVIILKNLGGIFKPNIFQWNDFYSIDVVLEALFSEDMDIDTRHKILKYKQLFRENLGDNYHATK